MTGIIFEKMFLNLLEIALPYDVSGLGIKCSGDFENG